MSDKSPISPTNLFARIETMKKWQMEHQQRLLEQQSQQAKFLTNEQRRMQEAFGEKQNETDIDQEEIIEHKEAPINIDELPINSPNKDFNMLLEENLNRSSSPIRQNVKPKQPFLRKGSGLGRFRMTLKDVASNSPQSHKSSKPRTTRRQQQQRRSSKFQEKVQEKREDTPRIQEKRETPKIQIEKYVEPIASWTSSQPSQPLQPPQPPQRPQPLQSLQSLQQSNYNSLLSELCQARQTDPELFNTPVINQSLETNQQLFERDLLDELKLFEALEQKVSNSSFCSNSSLVQRLMEHSNKSTPQKKYNFSLQSKYQSDEDSIPSPKKTVYFAHKTTPIEEETTDQSDDESEISSDANSTINSDDISNTPNNKNNHFRELVLRDAATNTDAEQISTELLKTRLEELETEIETFRRENARVNNLKIQFENDARNLEKQKSQLRKEVEEEKRQMKQQLSEEKTKIMKDKQLYDKYIRESREGRSSRQKDREELSALRGHVSSLQEELKLKESKWGATHARLRNQVRQLEKENTALKIENTELRGKNGKLEATNKQLLSRRPSDTKVLHEINKNLTKLAQENNPKVMKSKSEISKNTPKVVTPDEKNRRPSRNANTPDENNRRTSRSIEANDENNRNSLNSSGASTTQSFESIEQEYEKMFGKTGNEKTVMPPSEVSYTTDVNNRREEVVLEDGSLQITYPNGNVRTISANGKSVVMKYHNGDVKETCKDSGTIRYLYADAQVWHTTYPDGLELLEFAKYIFSSSTQDFLTYLIVL